MTPPPIDIAAMRRRPDLLDAAIAGAIITAAATILWLGRGLTFFADEWAVIGDGPLGIDSFFRPFNEA